MKNVLLGAVVVVSMFVYAHTATDELTVARDLVRRIMSSPEWNDNVKLGASVDEEELPFQEYEDLFQVEFASNCVGSTWTPSERRLAFENFIKEIPVLSTNGMYRAIEMHGGIALTYCQEHGASNVLDFAMNIITNKHSVAQHSALSVIEDFAVPSYQFNEYAMSVLTNSTLSTVTSRSYFVNAYASILRKHRDSCDAGSFTNGVRNLYRVVSSGTNGAIALDQLMLDTYPVYAESRQRLLIAESALSGRFESGIWSVSAVEDYFIPITNQLMNASQPLPEVEALRGL